MEVSGQPRVPTDLSLVQQPPLPLYRSLGGISRIEISRVLLPGLEPRNF